MSSYYALLQELLQVWKGLYIQNYRYFTHYLLPQSSNKNMFLLAICHCLLYEIDRSMGFHLVHSLLALENFHKKQQWPLKESIVSRKVVDRISNRVRVFCKNVKSANNISHNKKYKVLIICRW